MRYRGHIHRDLSLPLTWKEGGALSSITKPLQKEVKEVSRALRLLVPSRRLRRGAAPLHDVQSRAATRREGLLPVHERADDSALTWAGLVPVQQTRRASAPPGRRGQVHCDY